MSEKQVIGAIGAGRMGRGIAITFSYAGHQVHLIDSKTRTSDEAARLKQAAHDDIAKQLKALATAGAIQPNESKIILDRICFTSRDDAPDSLAKSDVVFEGVPETLEAKEEALRFCSKHMRANAILASTTSTILADKLSVFTRYPEQFLNAHWLNPAYLIPIVELSPTGQTASSTTQELKELLEGIGKVPVICAPSPGYIVPRIQALAMNEAARLVEQGVASAEEIDKATRYGFGFRFAILGLLEFIDWGGGDILYHASQHLSDTLNDDRYKAPAIINENMKDGHIGMGAGQGFYNFENMDLASYQQEKLTKLFALLKHMDLWQPPKTNDS